MIFELFRQQSGAADLYIDLGTANTLIASFGGGVLLNEPSILAVMETSPGKRKIIAAGFEALEKAKLNPGNIHLIRPLKDGVIADYTATENMLMQFLKRANVKRKFSRPRIVISLPYGVTDVEKKAAIDAGRAAGAKSVYLIDEPMAAAVGAGLPIKDARGTMIIDIGGGTTEVAVIALADIVYCEAVRVGGNKFDEAIQQGVRHKKDLIISEAQAEKIKLQLGTAAPRKDIREMEITGRDANSGLQKTITLNSEEIGQYMDGCLCEIIDAIHKALERTPPELVSDVMERGIMLAGGGALIRDIDIRFQNEVGLPVKLVPEPLLSIAKGGTLVLDDPELLDKIRIDDQ